MADGPPCKTSSTHEAATAAVDNQLGSSTGSNASAAAANHQQQQQQRQEEEQKVAGRLLACFESVWVARLYVAGSLQDAGPASQSLHLQASAHCCLQLIHQYVTAAGAGEPLQQQLLALLSGAASGSHLTAAAAATAATSAAVEIKIEPGVNQQQQQAIKLFDRLSWLVKAASTIHKHKHFEVQRRSHSRQATRKSPVKAPRTCSPSPATAALPAEHTATGSEAPSGAAAAAAAAPVPAAVDAESAYVVLQQVSVELSVSGVEAWGLAAHQLGPLLLDRTVGQAMLTVG